MKSRKIWKTVLIALGCALGAWVFGALLLPVLLPFFIGLAVSLLAEKPVRLLQTRAHVPRSLASGLCVLLLFGLLFGGLFFLCRLLCAEAADLARQLPQGKPLFFVYTYGGAKGTGAKVLYQLSLIHI